MLANGAPHTTKSATARPILVVLISRVRLYREAILGSLNRKSSIKAVGCVEIGDDLIRALDAVAPDAVLLEIGSSEALALAARIVRARPSTRILGFGVDDLPPQVIACAEAGLWGYVSSNASIVELVHAAQRVALSETVCSAELGDKLFRHLRSAALRNFGCTSDAPLTTRQQQILHLISEGLSNKQIAKRLSLGTSTVKNHVHGLLGRLHVGHRSEAVARMSRAGAAGTMAPE